MILAPDLDRRMRSAWSDLQQSVANEHNGISQIECDERCVSLFEEFVQSQEEAAKSRSQASSLMAIWNKIAERKSEEDMESMEEDFRQDAIEIGSQEGCDVTNQGIESIFEYLLLNGKTFEELKELIDED